MNYPNRPYSPFYDWEMKMRESLASAQDNTIKIPEAKTYDLEDLVKRFDELEKKIDRLEKYIVAQLFTLLEEKDKQ